LGSGGGSLWCALSRQIFFDDNFCARESGPKASTILRATTDCFLHFNRSIIRLFLSVLSAL
jgi:hypothetical protein